MVGPQVGSRDRRASTAAISSCWNAATASFRLGISSPLTTNLRASLQGTGLYRLMAHETALSRTAPAAGPSFGTTA